MKKPVFHRWFQMIAIRAVRITFKLLYGYRVIGKENVPNEACIIVPNHTQNSDACLVMAAVGDPVPFCAMAKKELFDIPLLNRLFVWIGGFPVDRSRADLSAVKTALRSVQEGKSLLIFPQGTRGDEDLAAKSGAAMFAVRTKAPVLPVYLPGNKKFWSRPYIVIGKPYLAEQTRDYDKVAEDMMQRIYALREEIR